MEQSANEAQGSISNIQVNETTKETEDSPNKYEDEPLNEIYLILKKDFLNSLIGYKNDEEIDKCCIPVSKIMDENMAASHIYDNILESSSGKELAYSDLFVWINNKDTRNANEMINKIWEGAGTPNILGKKSLENVLIAYTKLIANYHLSQKNCLNFISELKEILKLYDKYSKNRYPDNTTSELISSDLFFSLSQFELINPSLNNTIAGCSLGFFLMIYFQKVLILSTKVCQISKTNVNFQEGFDLELLFKCGLLEIKIVEKIKTSSGNYDNPIGNAKVDLFYEIAINSIRNEDFKTKTYSKKVVIEIPKSKLIKLSFMITLKSENIIDFDIIMKFRKISLEKLIEEQNEIYQRTKEELSSIIKPFPELKCENDLWVIGKFNSQGKKKDTNKKCNFI